MPRFDSGNVRSNPFVDECIRGVYVFKFMNTMKTKSLVLAGIALLCALGWWLSPAADAPFARPLPVNPMIGDLSFLRVHGRMPTDADANDLRVRTHLAYAEQLLRTRDVSHLPAEQQASRRQALDNLHDYWTAGIFPRNYDHAGQRRPCFIDRDGRICAVGYLIEQTAGREVAEQINSTHQYDRILGMHDATVDGWIAQSGLSKTECAIIQPTYGPPPSEDFISPGSAVASSGFTGLNATFVGLNGLQILRGAKPSKALAIASFVGGAGQIALGIATYPKPNDSWGGPYINESQQKLSMLNIGVGTSSIVMGIANLAMKRPDAKPKSTTWNIYGYPAGQQQVGLGFRFSKTL